MKWENSSTKMEMCMKENGLITRIMNMEFIFLEMVLYDGEYKDSKNLMNC